MILQPHFWAYIQQDTCTPMFIAALFTTAKTLKRPKCPSSKMGMVLPS